MDWDRQYMSYGDKWLIVLRSDEKEYNMGEKIWGNLLWFELLLG